MIAVKQNPKICQMPDNVDGHNELRSLLVPQGAGCNLLIYFSDAWNLFVLCGKKFGKDKKLTRNFSFSKV